ncbi:MAG TPA: Nif3-like dinuclear metal center hexameric protein [Phycisphaerae bacterium]|nr:Nif3-like dinuclear metal center hexameric protein [Phycisphaerae bacterium]
MARSRASMKVKALVEAMEKIAPTWAAEEWDNVGLLVGSEAWKASRAMLTVDLTPAVLGEASGGGFDVIVAYHPPIFRPVKRMTPDGREQAGLAAEALARRIAVYSPHTAWDAAVGGTNDTLAGLCGLDDVRPAASVGAGDPKYKLVVFVPASHVERMAEAIYKAGAGRIGDYEKCSFRLRGQGTFFGTETTDPVVGRRGRLERVEEIRLEAIFPRRALAEVTAAIRRFHPYEEPAFDVYPLETVLDRRMGQGRIGRFAKPVTLRGLARSLACRVKAGSIVTIGGAGTRLRRGVVWVGAAGSAPLAACKPCGPGDVVITGEVRHHEALQYQRQGVAVIALGHWASERPALKPMAAGLKKLLPDVAVAISRADRDPFESV